MPPRKKHLEPQEEVVIKNSAMSQLTSILDVSADDSKKAVSITADCTDGAAVLADLLKNLDKDCYNEDEATLKFLYSKPSCFLILGKPGVGKTSLAKRFAAEWKCLIINSTEIILENMQLRNEIGLKCKEILGQGGEVSDEMVLKMIEDKVNSTEVAHHGYVMDDFPCLSEDLLSIQDQLELIKNWKLKPDFVINLRIPEKDIERRRLDQKIDPITGVIYTKEVYAPDSPILPSEDIYYQIQTMITVNLVPVSEKTAGENEEDNVEVDEEIEEENHIEDDNNTTEPLSPEILKRLVVRPEDMPQQVEQNLAKYKSNMLRTLEDYMGDHDQQYLVELDGNLPVISLFKELMQKLQTFVLYPAAVVTRLTDPDDDELTDDMETDDIMRALNSKNMLAPRYRWHRSRWLRNCPVALYEGNVTPGKPEFAVSFLDKIYCLSSAAALQKFMKNPRPYLVPKQPMTTCKFSVVGQPFSGKTTLCHLLAQYYNAKVFDIHNLARQRKIEEKKKHIEQVRQDTTEQAIQQVKNRIKAQWETERARKEKERQARLAVEAEALRLEQERIREEEEEDESSSSEDPALGKKAFHEDVPTGGEASKQQKDAFERGKSSSDTKKEDTDENLPDLNMNKDGEDLLEDVTDEGLQQLEDDNPLETEDTLEIPIIAEDVSVVKDDIDPMEMPEPMVDASHPEVQAIVDIAVSMAKISPIKITPEYFAELMETAIKDWEKELRSSRHDGPLFGCWILDNFPETAEQWNACVERNIIPDAVYVLGVEIHDVNIEKLKLTCERYCLKNKDFIYGEISRRDIEIELKNQEARFKAQQKLIQEEEKIKKAIDEEKERQKMLDEEAKVAEAARQESLEKFDRDATTAEAIPADDDPALATPVQVSSAVLDDDQRGEGEEEDESLTDNDVETIPDKTELEILMEQPEAKLFMEKLLHFEPNMGNLLAAITQTSSVIPFRIAFDGYTLEEVFETVIRNEEKAYKYNAWEIEQADIDEMEDDLDAEGGEAPGLDNADDKEEGVEEDEDQSRGMKQFLGESNYFDPVILKDTHVLYPGNAEIAAMYRERMYYFSSNEARDKFIDEPLEFLQVDKPLNPPPLRLLILGPRGTGKSLHSTYLSEKLGIFHISFNDRLQELIIAKTKKRIGPEYEEDMEDSILDDSIQMRAKMSTGQAKTHYSNAAEDDDDDDSDEIDGDGSPEEEESRTPGSDENELMPESNVSFLQTDSDLQSSKEDMNHLHEINRIVETIETTTSSFVAKQGLTGLNEIILEEDEEVNLTEFEEAIKANLENNEPLSNELLESILKPFWTREPYKSTGFILEGFPRTAEEARFIQESGLFPDAAILLQASEDDVTGRLLPPKLDLWKARRLRRLARRAHSKEKNQAKRNAAIARRKEILLKEREARHALRKKESNKELDEEKEDDDDDDVGDEEEVEEEEEEDIEAILAEEFEEEEEAEEEEDEELEEDAMERMKIDISDMFADENDRLTGVMETLEEILIPCLEVAAGRKPHIVRYIFNKKIKPFVEYRKSMFERVYPISEQLAKQMLQVGYKQPSCFGRWDPVQLKEGKCIQPLSGPDHPSFACVYRSYIYYLSSQYNRLTFIQDPLTYLNQKSPKPVVPLRISIIGPPKSGKTTLANRFVEDYGVVRLSIGEAMRGVLAQHPKSELAKQILWNLVRGRVVPDELQVQALDVALLDVRCQTRGYVLDGYPMTLRQIELMTEHSIIPVRVIELELNSKEVLVRGVKDRLTSARTMALHDSTQIVAIKLSCYQRTVPEVRNWYQSQHRNYTIVPADKSKWWVLDAVHEIATSSIKRIQDYLFRTAQGGAAGITGLCITPSEFQARLGDLCQYCPVSLTEWNELVDCSSNETLEFSAEFRGHYYKMAGQKELDMFLANPEKYVPPFALHKLPPSEELPHVLPKEELESRQAEILGYCPVTYLDGNLRYEALVPGNPSFAVEYKGKIYLMENKEKLDKFMKQPEKYANLTLPHKLPPAPEDMPLQNLPMLGFMEQTCAIAMIKALTAAGNVKPKYPFISSTRSALIYIAYHLKAFNPKSSPYIRKKYKQKLQQFQETCELIKYLGNNMTVRYRDPNERPKDFDNKLEMFFALRGIEPTPTWLK